MGISIKSIYNWYKQAIGNPKYRWWVILGTLVYLLSPLDISPDIFPVIGQIDDLVIVGLLISEVSQMVLNRSQSPANQTEAANSETDVKTVDVDAVSLD